MILLSRYKNLKGEKFGRLKVLKIAGRDEVSRCILWKCKCNCGNTTIVRSNSLLTGNTKSCGCLHEDITTKKNKERAKHGKCNTRLYRIWAHMKERCMKADCKSYKYYGKRDISVCDEWMEFEPFYKWAIANGYKKNLELDRINNDGNYCPENCRWVTRKVQANNKSNNVILEYNGKKMTLAEWSDYTGINYSTLESRLNQSGWSVEKTLTTPLLK